jgi:hypothetical protein
MKTSQVSPQPSLWLQIISIFTLPVVGLYILAYRLLGIRYRYTLGNFEVTPRQPLTQGQHLFIRAFPTMVLTPIFGLVMALAYWLIK